MTPNSAHMTSTVRTNLLAFLRQQQSFTIGPIRGWEKTTFLGQNLVSVKVTDICEFHPFKSGQLVLSANEEDADEIASGVATVVNEDQDPMVHVYKMSDEVDEYFAGDLSGESSLAL